jgi:hypothetical protein
MKIEKLVDTIQFGNFSEDEMTELCEKANQLHHVATKSLDLHLAISIFLQDYKDGDFQLPELAQIHVREIRRKYTDMGKALFPIQNDL